MPKRALALVALVLALPTMGSAQIPKTLSYQGVLTQANGTPVPDGNVTLTFRLYGGPTGGSPLWEETQTVAVQKGVFTALLGAVNALSLPFDKPYHLGLSVAGGDELTPRTGLTSSPYAFTAGNVTDSGKVVRMINGLTDTVTVVGAGGTTVTTLGKTLVVTSTPPGTGGGMAGIQDPTGSLAIANPNGPVATVSVADNGIRRRHIANGQVVKSLNTLTDAVQLVEGQNIDITTISGIGVNDIRFDAFSQGGTVGGNLAVLGNIAGNGAITARQLHIISSEGDTLTSFDSLGYSDHRYFETFREGALFEGQVSIRTGKSVTGEPVTMDIGGGEFFNRQGITFRTPSGHLPFSIDEKGLRLGFGNGQWLSLDSSGIGIWANDLFGPVMLSGFRSDGTSIHQAKETFYDSLHLRFNAKLVFPDGSVLTSAGGAGGVFANTPLVVKNSQGAETFRVNPDGTSVHAGTETFNNGIILKDGPGDELTVQDSLGNQVLGVDAGRWFKAVNPHVTNENPMVNVGKTQSGPPGAPASISESWKGLALHRLNSDGSLARSPAGVNEGPVIYGATSRPFGVGVNGYVTSTANVAPAVWGLNAGGGAGVLAEVRNTSSNYPGLWSITNGTGSSLLIDHQGASGNVLTARSGGTNVARIDKTGKGFFNGGTQASGADVAEAFEVEGPLETYAPGDVLVISRNTDRTVEKSVESYSTLVAGVYASRPGVLLTERDVDDPLDDMVPMGVVGVLPTRVTGENGAIRRGDLLVTASTPGHAMKGTDPTRMVGAVLGKALENFDGDSGIIRVLISTR